MKRIYVFGNPFLKEDGVSLTLAESLKRSFPGVEFVVMDPNDNFPPSGERDLLILDAVKGIAAPTLLDFNDLENVEKSPVSPHDYDLLLHLLLLKKTKRIDAVRIIGIPYGADARVADAVRGIISSLL